ncbi:ferredoxin [Actinomadura sp. DC4]|uniref:ferredoxin n=1 Tax=Actinomadura sp. DC4 TaxID=3055069 RepID=UPI0025B05191|nr:ferredoxin [Actinomadura sp. DC4]MDN3354307.1 ferredoxin [Actinomadura sp. DC4]
MTMMELQIDPIACDGAGLCAELLPEHITLDEWGYPIVELRQVTAETRRHAHRAVTLCPKLALHLSRQA